MTRKAKSTFTPEQRLDYAKLMINENYTNKQIMDISKATAFFVRDNLNLN